PPRTPPCRRARPENTGRPRRGPRLPAPPVTGPKPGGQGRLPLPPPRRASFRVPPSPAVPPVARDDVDPPNGTHDSGKHSRLSNTNNVSGPIARRSTGIQRGASGNAAPPTPGNAGTAPSPSHTGAWTQ